MNARDARQLHELVTDLASLNSERPQPTLRREEPRGGIPSRRGYAEKNYQPGSGSGTAGIASPLTEGSQSAPDSADPTTPTYDREYYEPIRQAVSSDGLFFWEWRELKTLRMRDANGNPVTIELAQEPEDE